MIKHLWNQSVTIALCVLASLYILSIIDAEWLWITLCYTTNFRLGAVILCSKILIALFLISLSLYCSLLQNSLQQKGTPQPATIFYIQLGLFMVVFLDLQIFHILPYSTLAYTLVITGIGMVIIRFYQNQKLINQQWDSEYV